MDFSGKNVLITGGSRGIGRAIAKAFADHGAQVAVNFRSDSQSARETCEEMKGSGHFAVKADVSKAESVRRMMTAVINEFGTLHIVVNNAGIFEPHPIDKIDYKGWIEAWDKTMKVNLNGPANVCYWAAHYMKGQGLGGRIINISSRGAFRGEPDHPAYGASKAALNAMSQSLAQKLAPYRIAVSVVAPGFVMTDMTEDILRGEKGEDIRAQSPLDRVARPEEIAQAVLYLATPEAEYASGAIIDVNGASYLRS
ncbi:MAG: SDR family oxidoreductase [Saprospiraceae bacterium]|nr:SDR family oxidoreductase [Saprospiraceae bacterium]